MAPVSLLAAIPLSVAFLVTAAADSTVVPPMPGANEPGPGVQGGAVVMPIAGLPESRVYVYPMTADPRAAADQLRLFAAMFHASNPETYRDFTEQWERLKEKRIAVETARASDNGGAARPAADAR